MNSEALQGEEEKHYQEIISKLEPIYTTYSLHIFESHFEVEGGYIVEYSFDRGDELYFMNQAEYEDYTGKYGVVVYQPELKIPIPDYIGQPVLRTTLDGILNKYYDSQDGAARIARERRRQKEVEGWTLEHDLVHEDGELVDAAVTYLRKDFYGEHEAMVRHWPWEPEWFKPTTRIRDLEKAGALIAAEIDRLKAVKQDWNLYCEQHDRQDWKK